MGFESLLRQNTIKYSFTAFLFFNCLSASAQTETPYPPASFEKIDSFIENAMIDWKVPGLSLGIIKNGELIYAKGYGCKDLETREPVTPHTVFPIGSVTKSFTAAAILKLQEDSLINIDRPVIDYAPDFEMYDDYVNENITTRDLLTHRTGLARHDFMWYGTEFNRKELFSKIKYLQPNSSFREKFQYQNIMYMAAGSLIEEITGKTWETYMKENFIDPMGMVSTTFSVKDIKSTGDYALPYYNFNDTIIPIPFKNIDAVGPAGSINSNVEDLSKWLITNMNYGTFEDKKILTEKSVWEMQTPNMVVPSGISDDVFYTSYGLGWFLTSYRGSLRVEHGGNIDGFTAGIAMYPFDSLGIIVLSNLNSSSITSVVRNTVFDMLMDLPDAEWNAMLLESYKEEMAKEKSMEDDSLRLINAILKKPAVMFTGTYRNPAYGTLRISYNNDSLIAIIHDLRYTLKPVSDYKFVGRNIIFGNDEFIFTVNNKGVVKKVSVPFEPEVNDIEFKKVNEPKQVIPYKKAPKEKIKEG